MSLYSFLIHLLKPIHNIPKEKISNRPLIRFFSLTKIKVLVQIFDKNVKRVYILINLVTL